MSTEDLYFCTLEAVQDGRLQVIQIVILLSASIDTVKISLRSY